MTESLVGIDSTPQQSGFERYKASSVIHFSKEKLDQVVAKTIDPFNEAQLKSFTDNCKPIPFKNGPYGAKDYGK